MKALVDGWSLEVTSLLSERVYVRASINTAATVHYCYCTSYY